MLGASSLLGSCFSSCLVLTKAHVTSKKARQLLNPFLQSQAGSDIDALMVPLYGALTVPLYGALAVPLCMS